MQPLKSLALLLMAFPACTAAGDPSSGFAFYTCDNDVVLEVSEFPDRAVVSDGRSELRLPMKPMSIGRRYASEEGVLILDDDRAVYVEAGSDVVRHCLVQQGSIANR